ncbi:hypothetical protein [uncultured Gammaproteobacteria bacterium]|jgi:IS30 family transposase|nr:hypothetical protein [uncultured Gammaproteobacteria bacterium]CAC9598952.1 hypothetical protein [uncultured Gammaproteobacteria bacterium]CAC9626229.1 hypothetical protein [uncultured Gammaproteobacteria bacterium]CAC9998040.1 hypothetical protein [uncultured Gammaproteobacteria bacterium]SSC10502.1 hypothetical protein BPUTEOSOX_1969 [thiotrophic endosymbiont of Bathymodiolus puteoserpentis (Logatchev)]
MQVSHETIYSYIYTHPKGGLKKIIIHSLRQSKSKRGPRGSKNSNYHTMQPEQSQLFIIDQRISMAGRLLAIRRVI